MPLATLTYYYDISEARIVAGFLESHSIAAHINGQHMASVDIGMIVAMGGLALQVSEADENRARLLLYEAQTSGSEKCPRCRSVKIWKQPKASASFFQIIASVMAGGTQAPRHSTVRRCLTCQHQWDIKHEGTISV